MSRQARRRQLLALAAEIVREEGSDALTLAVLAERAGVTKPIAYDHFGSRDGLLVALYRDWDEAQIEAAQLALEGAGADPQKTAAVLAQSYIDCCIEAGGAFYAIAAALEGSAEMQAAKRELRARYLKVLRKALAPHLNLSDREMRALALGLLGAADALGAAAAERRVSRATAADVLERLIAAALGKE